MLEDDAKFTKLKIKKTSSIKARRSNAFTKTFIYILFPQNNKNYHASKPIHDQPNLKPIIENINCHNPYETSYDTIMIIVEKRKLFSNL